MRRWGGLALGVLFAGSAIGLARISPSPHPELPSPEPGAPIEPAGEALIYRALLIRERGDLYGAYAMARAVASGAAGPVAAEKARELLAEPPPVTVEFPLTEYYTEVRFDEHGQVEVIGPDHRTLFDVSSGRRVRHVPRQIRGTSTEGAVGRRTKGRVAEDWSSLARRDHVREHGQPRIRAMGAQVQVFADGERTTFDVPGATRPRAALSADGSTICAGTRNGRVFLRAVDGGEPLVGQLEGAVTAIVPMPEQEGEAPAFLVGTKAGQVARATAGRERDVYGDEPEGGAVVVVFDMLARAGPPVRWFGVTPDGEPVAMDDEGILTWAEEQRLGGVTVDPVVVARRVVRWGTEERRDAALGPEGGRIAVLSRGALQVISLVPGLPLCSATGGGLFANVHAARDGSRVVLQSRDTITVCDVEAPGEPLMTIPVPNPDQHRSGRARLSADGRRLIVPSRIETRIFDVDSGDRVGLHHHDFGSHVSPDGTVALVNDRLVSTRDGSAIDPDCVDGNATSLRMLDEAEVLVAFEDERLVVCELDEEADLLFRTDRFEDLPGSSDYGGVGASADGSHLWLGTRDGKVRLFELPSGRLVRAFHAGESGMPHATVANGGAYVMTSSSRRRTRLFVTATGEQVLERESGPMGTDGPGAPPESFSGDGAYYARIGGIREGSQTTWVSATGEELPVTRPFDYGLSIEVRGVAFPLGSGPDLLATSGDGTAIFRGTPDGLVALMRVRPSATAVTEGGRFIVWWGDSARRIPVGTSGPDAAALTATVSNHRVCRESFDPVVVPLAQIDDPIWAPDSLCD